MENDGESSKGVREPQTVPRRTGRGKCRLSPTSPAPAGISFHLGDDRSAAYGNHGQRVVEGQRLTQAASDIMLGWIRMTAYDGVSRDFYMRQLWDGKGSALVDLMNPPAMTVYAEVCGRALAKAHARSGDAIAIASYLGAGDSFDRALASFAEAYADQNERDYNALREAVSSGRVASETGL